MRLVLSLLVLIALLPACRRRQPPHQAGLEPAPVVTTEPEKAEPEPEEPKQEPAAPAPAPAAPTSPPPASEAGFSFGMAKRDAMNRCSVKGVWRRDGQNYACTLAPEDPGFEGSPVVSFCNDVVCAVGIAVTPSATDFATWDQTFGKMQAALVARHGEPTSKNDQIPDDCKNDSFVACLDDGRALRELSWQWDTHVVTLRMSKRKSGDGPSAIRFVSMPRTAAGG